MNVVFISNYYTHHQAPFCEAMYKLTNGHFCFIETSPMEEERKSMGWMQDNTKSFVKNVYANEQDKVECEGLINNADIVIKGNGPYELIRKRIKAGKLTFIYSERVYKNNKERRKIPFHYFKFGKWYRGYSNLFLLCASAFASADYKINGCFVNKAFKWGYFTELRKYDNVDVLLEEKKLKHHSVSILWAARLIEWKHPEYAVYVAKKLKDEGFSFILNIIGNGEKEKAIKRMIDEQDLSDCVKMLGAMSPDEVRNQMECSDIFLFTSDQNEGWGAVLNESMNSACAVVASHAIGSVPFLINDGENGLIYKDGDIEDLYSKVKWLIENEEKRIDVAQKAYYTVAKQWNAENAASRLLILASSLHKGEITPFENGVCSVAHILQNNWYR